MTHYVDQVVGADLFIDSQTGVTRRVETVVVTDDSATTRKVLGKMLLTMGVPNTLEAATAGDAFRLLHENRVDLLICDVEMPEVNGLKLLRAIRRTPKLRNLPVILMTASLNARHLHHAQEAEADVYLLKPFNGDHLRDKIKDALNREAAHARS